MRFPVSLYYFACYIVNEKDRFGVLAKSAAASKKFLFRCIVFEIDAKIFFYLHRFFVVQRDSQQYLVSTSFL